MKNDLSDQFLQDVEAVFFLEGKAVALNKVVRLTNSTKQEVEQAIGILNEKYRKHSHVFHIEQIEDSRQLTVNPEYQSPLLENYSSRKKKLSKVLLETLGIIAYKQPITKNEIESIRGSGSSHHIKTLTEDGFIKIAGKKKDSPGNPYIYVTTKRFLLHFNLKSLKDLPTISEIKTYDFLDLLDKPQEND